MKNALFTYILTSIELYFSYVQLLLLQLLNKQ